MPKRKSSKGGEHPPGEYFKLLKEEKRAYHSHALKMSWEKESEKRLVAENLAPGCIVRAKYAGVWYPAKIVSSSDVPSYLLKNLFRSKRDDAVVVKWYRVDKFSRLKSDNIDLLAENKIDASRAAKNDKINLLYQLGCC
jgi:hypothetical protein